MGFVWKVFPDLKVSELQSRGWFCHHLKWKNDNHDHDEDDEDDEDDNDGNDGNDGDDDEDDIGEYQDDNCEYEDDDMWGMGQLPWRLPAMPLMPSVHPRQQ